MNKLDMNRLTIDEIIRSKALAEKISRLLINDGPDTKVIVNAMAMASGWTIYTTALKDEHCEVNLDTYCDMIKDVFETCRSVTPFDTLHQKPNTLN